MKPTDLDKDIEEVLPKVVELLQIVLPEKFIGIFMDVYLLSSHRGKNLHSDFGNDLATIAVKKCKQYLESYNKAHPWDKRFV